MSLTELGQQFSARYLASLGGEASALAQGVDPGQAAMSGAMIAFRKTVIAFLAAIVERVVPQRYLNGIKVRLGKAGVPYELSGAEVVAFQVVCFGFFWVMGALISFWLDVNFFYGDEGPDLTGSFVTVGLAVLGAFYPLLWLGDKVRDRQHKIVRALPYNLDLLTLSVEAGLDFAAAHRR